MPSGKEASDGEARETINSRSDASAVGGREVADGVVDAERGGEGAAGDGLRQQQRESAATTVTHPSVQTSPGATASAEAGSGEAAVPAPAPEGAVAAAVLDSIVEDPAGGLDSPTSSGNNAAATHAGDGTTGDPPRTSTGDGDPQGTAGVAADHHQHDPAAAASAARAMVRDDDEGTEGGQPKRVTLQNYASRDSGAVMLESSSLSKGMPNLLLDSKDKYAITPCEQQQWAVLGLSEDILVKTIVIGSYEKYSSLIKDFQILASQKYPVNEWLDLGTFTAKFEQGEQTFEMPQPAFARYLKFKFLSHYGDDFYCTVSQVKVHGSTMIESLQHEWQQSTAEVLEVQDYMKKKDPKSVAAATAAAAAAAAAGSGGDSPTIANGGVSYQASGGGARGSEIANNVEQTTTPGGAPQSAGAGIAPVNDGTFEHRPHAASAASVTTGGSAAGGAGTGTATVEDIVRGVPAEMVLPATTTTCVGPTGRDGSCREETLTHKVAATEGGAAGSAASLGAEIPTMGGSRAGGKLNDGSKFDGGGEGLGVAAFGKAGGEDGSAGTARESATDLGRPIAESEGTIGAGNGATPEQAIGHQKNAPSRDNGQAQLEDRGAIDDSVATAAAAAATAGSKAAGVKAPVSAAGDGAVVKEGGAGIAAGDGRDAQTGGGEKPPPPRKGIISSTMEAISKVVHRGEESQPPNNDPAEGVAKSGEVAVGADGGSGTAAVSSGGSVEEEAKVGDRDVGPRSSKSSSASDGASSVEKAEVDAREGGHVGMPSAATDSAAAPGASIESEPPVVKEPDSIHTTVERQRWSNDASLGDTGAVKGGSGPSTGNVKDEALEAGSLSDLAGASADASRETAANGQPIGNDESSNAPSVLKAESVGPDARGGGGSNGEHQNTEGAAAIEPTGQGEHLPPAAGIASPPQSADASTDDQEGHTDPLSTMATGAGTGAGAGAGAGAGTGGANHVPAARSQAMEDDSSPKQGRGGLPPTARTRDEHVPAAGQAGGSLDVVPPSPPVVLIEEETSAAALAAACLNSLSFSEFRDEVLARTQQAQQSAGGGVAIGGQYESIFKTLMNKIKTLEINQSLYSLYIDDVHSCYHDVIGQMLQEQERARASRLELLNVQAAHLTQVGDHWPAFQDLQAKVVEVENRMLLSSLAWFTSLFCLGLMIISCCFKVCRSSGFSGRDGGSSSGRGRRGGGRPTGLHDGGVGCDTCSPGRSTESGSMSYEGNGTTGTTPAKEMLHWRANGGGGSSGGGDNECWEAASMAERVRGGHERYYSPGVVSRF